MNNEEYIIINKSKILERIEELKLQKVNLNLAYDSEIDALGEINMEINTLNNVLSNSTPLIPEIEKAFDKGNYETLKHYDSNDKSGYLRDKENYISDLKLNI